MIAAPLASSVKTKWQGMPAPVQALVGVTFAFALLTLFLAVLGSARGRAPEGLSYDGSRVTSISETWAVFAGVAITDVILLIRHWLAWLALMVAFLLVLVTSNFDDLSGTARQVAIIIILALPVTRAYYGVRRPGG